MRYICMDSLWNKDQWRYIFRPKNIFWLHCEYNGVYIDAYIAIFGFVFHFDDYYERRD
jgi:hypothetical protein